VLAGLVGVICEAYIDDIVIFANTLDELNARVHQVMDRFRKYKLILHPLKFVFGVSEIEFLGHMVSANGISLSAAKRDGLVKIPVPSDRAALRAFLGLANYFREFIPRYAIRTFNMSKLLSPKVDFRWTDVQDKEFVDVKDAVANAPMLHHINYDFPIIIRSDASNIGVGAVLLQLSDNVEQFVAFASAKFSKAASRWATPDQEAYAFVFAIRTWEHYLRGHKFVVETDEHFKEVDRAVKEFRAGGFKGFVYVMPQGGTKEAYEANLTKVADMAMARGFYLSPRLHCSIWGNGWAK
jgi:hypothetical protein